MDRHERTGMILIFIYFFHLDQTNVGLLRLLWLVRVPLVSEYLVNCNIVGIISSRVPAL